MSISDKDVILQNLMNTILYVAMDDGIITPDELAILKQVKLDINMLRKTLKDAEKDEETTSEEQEQLVWFRKNLLQNIYNISKADHVITQDERNLINTLIKALMS